MFLILQHQCYEAPDLIAHPAVTPSHMAQWRAHIEPGTPVRILRPGLHLQWEVRSSTRFVRRCIAAHQAKKVMPTQALTPHSEVCPIPLAPAHCQARPWGSFIVRSLRWLGNGDEDPKDLVARTSFVPDGAPCPVSQSQGRAWRRN